MINNNYLLSYLIASAIIGTGGLLYLLGRIVLALITYIKTKIDTKKEILGMDQYFKFRCQEQRLIDNGLKEEE